LTYINRKIVRFGSKADVCSAKRHVRFTPNSDRGSGFPQEVMSALPPKADMCEAKTNVRFVPIADIREIDLREHDQAVAIAAELRDLRRFTHQTRRPLWLLSIF
jgi:hypothetical protein